MLKPTCSYDCASWMCVSLCLRLSSYLRLAPRDLPWGKIECQRVWKAVDRCIEWWPPLVVWKFTSEQLQKPAKLVEFLELLCCLPGSAREAQITAACWNLAHVYQSLFNTIQQRQGEENGPTWRLWQNAWEETWDQPLVFWSQGYRRSKAYYIPTERKKRFWQQRYCIQAALDVVGTEA